MKMTELQKDLSIFGIVGTKREGDFVEKSPSLIVVGAFALALFYSFLHHVLIIDDRTRVVEREGDLPHF